MSSTHQAHPFGRYTREDCGLPEIGSPLPGSGLSFWKGFLLFALLALAGWFAGEFSARQRADWVATLPVRIHRARTSEIPGLLERGKLYATALPDNQILRCNLAYSIIIASERSPRHLGFIANAANLFRGLDLTQLPTPLDRFHALLAASETYANLKEYPAAMQALDEADHELRELPDQVSRPYRLVLINAKAYFLAEAPITQGGDAKRGLELATLMISSRDRLPSGRYASDSAAFLDTLALARYRTGDRTGALAAQTLALGMADQDLAVYLNHYDDFSLDLKNRDGKAVAAGIVDMIRSYKTHNDAIVDGDEDYHQGEKNPGPITAGPDIKDNDSDNETRGNNGSIPK